MIRDVTTLTIAELRQRFLDIEFPEYQREPNIWSRDQKQRLIDSILRQFDISAVYMFERDSGVLECIDGRQRLNAIMSFLGENPLDARDNGFPLRVDNEISAGLQTEFDDLSLQTFASLVESGSTISQAAVEAVLSYPLNVVRLSGAAEGEEFNLQFLRLNLGTLINAGEKLHAMVGQMRDEIFEQGGIGKHEFFDQVRIPGRRYSKELTGAQVLLQAVSRRTSENFARARHFDLQRFVKEHAELGDTAPIVESVRRTLDELHAGAPTLGAQLRNRAMTVSVVLLAWEQGLNGTKEVSRYSAFVTEFTGRLRWLLKELREFRVPDDRYRYLIDFQRHLTQAAVEKPAVGHRHKTLLESWASWEAGDGIRGDAQFKAETKQDPPTA